MNSKTLLLIILVVVSSGVAAGVLLLNQNNKKSPAPPVVVETITPSGSPSPSPLPGEITLHAVTSSGANVSGTAGRSVRPEHFMLTVKATLPEPTQGSFYQVWLMRPSPPAQFSPGKLVKNGDTWTLTLDQTRDASAYSQIIVTAETKDDNVLETRLLEANFPGTVN